MSAAPTRRQQTMGKGQCCRSLYRSKIVAGISVGDREHQGSYYLTANQLKYGQSFNEHDFVRMHGELNTLPSNTIIDLNKRLAKHSGQLFIGYCVTRRHAKGPLAVQQGQTVKLISSGVGFRVSTEATALTNANEDKLQKRKQTMDKLLQGLLNLVPS